MKVEAVCAVLQEFSYYARSTLYKLIIGPILSFRLAVDLWMTFMEYTDMSSNSTKNTKKKWKIVTLKDFLNPSQSF